MRSADPVARAVNHQLLAEVAADGERSIEHRLAEAIQQLNQLRQATSSHQLGGQATGVLMQRYRINPKPPCRCWCGLLNTTT